jgi:cytochrome c peroxidase
MGFLTAGVATVVGAQEESKPEYSYIGVAKCKMCHKKESTGDQFGIWSKGPHAKAYESLASEESMAKAKEMGLGNPQEEPECLRCHVTAFAVWDDLEKQKIGKEEGVSCEGCHGPGSAYKGLKVMKAITAGEVSAESVGLLVPDEAACKQCHNPDNPFHKEFVFKDYFEKIAHPIPEGSSSSEDEGEGESEN